MHGAGDDADAAHQTVSLSIAVSNATAPGDSTALAEAVPQLAKAKLEAQASLGLGRLRHGSSRNWTRGDLADLSRMHAPPAAVVRVICAVEALMGRTPTGKWAEQSKLLKDSSFCGMLSRYDVDHPATDIVMAYIGMANIITANTV